MASRYVDELIDEDEVPELTDEDAARSVSFEELPEEVKAPLREMMAGNVTFRPDPVKTTVALASDVASRIERIDERGQAQVEMALRAWLDAHEHEFALKKAS